MSAAPRTGKTRSVGAFRKTTSVHLRRAAGRARLHRDGSDLKPPASLLQREHPMCSRGEGRRPRAREEGRRKAGRRDPACARADASCACGAAWRRRGRSALAAVRRTRRAGPREPHDRSARSAGEQPSGSAARALRSACVDGAHETRPTTRRWRKACRFREAVQEGNGTPRAMMSRATAYPSRTRTSRALHPRPAPALGAPSALAREGSDRARHS